MKKMISKVKQFFGLDTEIEETVDEATSQPIEQQPVVQEEKTQQPKRTHLQAVPHTVQEQRVQESPMINKKKEFRFPLIKDDEMIDESHMHGNHATSERVEKKSAVFEDHRDSDTLHLPKHLPTNTQVFDVEVSGIRDLLEKRGRSYGTTNVVRLHNDTLPARKKRNVTRDETVFLTNNPARQDVVEKKENPAFINPLENKKRFVPTHVPSPVHGFNEPKPIKELMKEQFDADLTIPVVIQAEEVVPTNNDQQVHTENHVEQQEQPFVNKATTNEDHSIKEPAIEVQQGHPAVHDEKEQLTAAQQDEQVTKLDDLQLQHLTIENSTVNIGQIHVEPAQTVEKVLIKEHVVETQQAEPPNTVNEEGQQNISEEIITAKESAQKSSGSKIPFNVLMLSSDKNKMKGNPFQQIKSGVPATITEKVELRREAQQGLQQVGVKEVQTAYSEEDTSEPMEERQEAQMTEGKSDSLYVPQQNEIAAEALQQTSQNTVAVLEREPELDNKECVKPMSTPQQVMDLLQVAEQQEAPILDELYTTIHSSKVEDEGETVHSDQTEQLEKQLVNVDIPQPVHFDQNEHQHIQQEASNNEILEHAAAELTEQVESDTNLSQLQVQIPEPEAGHTQLAEQQVDLHEVESVEEVKVVKPYEKPSLEILVPPEEKTEDWAWMDEQADYLIAALASHQIKAQIESIVQGPAVTQFEITVAAGTKVSKVRNLSDDIKLALAAKDIRIDAPIPGKRTIGIEIPNRISRAVRLSEVTNSEVFQNSESPLEAALGLNLNGKPVTIDLRKMPHGLIAGATGSGKSVCINSILVSLLYKADPHELKLMLIDPKMVELAPFNNIPHLVSPVITDVKAATAALKWAVEEMENRYQLFMHAGVRDITRYNSQAEKAGKHAQKMPYILIVIDELADLMMMSPADVEEAICRIAQKARACGIHLIVATQRPSVDVITGLIKSNIPTRIAFAVSSAIDSRTILDGTGAERLLGRGDMLYLGNGMPAPIRLQGTFVTDDEIEEIIDYVRSQGEPNYFFAHEDLLKKAEFVEEQDELFEDVCRYVYEAGTASTSSIQRRYHIGYNRAARLVEMLEGHGFVSEQRGSKPREVFITEADLENLFS